MEAATVSLETIARLMHEAGASRILLKELANNDNSKQQIYLGSDLQVFPSGEIYSATISKKGPIFKAPINLSWISVNGQVEQAKHSQLILYPKYPEVRLSGMAKGCKLAPGHLLQPPTLEERAKRRNIHRYLVIGIRHDSILAYISAWEDHLSKEAKKAIECGMVHSFASVFFEYRPKQKASREILLEKLQEIYLNRPTRSGRLTSDGQLIEYRAKNGAGFTLEAQFGISPNGIAAPDFMDWELKSHSKGPITLMTPEPDSGTYLDNLESFMRLYGTNIRSDRMDFACRHSIGQINQKTQLTINLEGYDSCLGEIIDPNGGLVLRDKYKTPVAKWSYSKIIDHWKKKHSNTCFVSYETELRDVPYYTFGPKLTLASGADIRNFLSALYNNIIYYDPGINMKLIDGRWKPKKRNQFRVAWKNVSTLYSKTENILLHE